MKYFLPTSKGYSSNNLRITAAGFNITLQNILTAPDSFILSFVSMNAGYPKPNYAS